jgi:hypothetical protein
MPEKSPGEIAYTAYGDAVGWKTMSGSAMPPWSEQAERLRIAWDAAGAAVAAVLAVGDIADTNARRLLALTELRAIQASMREVAAQLGAAHNAATGILMERDAALANLAIARAERDDALASLAQARAAAAPADGAST